MNRWKYCKRCGEKFPRSSKYKKICKECIKESYKIGRKKMEELKNNGVEIGKPCYLR